MSANIVSVDNPIKIVSTSKINKVFSTNAVNSIEVSKEKIIKSNNKLREVVEAGYLLSNINLSTVPDVIADAITKAMSDTKDAVLSDSLLSTLRTDLENLDDGVYKKTYIDNTITYLENLLTSKVDLETVASIADSKIATASEGFAAASTVNLLTSRVGNSESAIISLAETVNTKDTARANQITELEASIDESFSGYSEAIDLYVDAEGNVISRKIEEIAAQNYSAKVSINELNEITLDDEGTYTAYVAKTITDSNGKTVGLQFADSNELTSFLINADTFKISNSTNDYTPFSIVDNNLLFNGKVTFSNITGGDSILTVDNVQDAINNNVTSIDGGKIVTNAAFVNNLNATGGIVADTIRANKVITSPIINGGEVNSTTLNSTTINSAIINSPTINGLNLSISDIKVKSEGDPSKFGKITQSLTSGYIYGLSYGAGFIANRVCSNSSIIKVTGFLNIYIGTDGNYGTSWSLSGRLYDSYGTLDSKTISASANGTQLAISTTIIFTAIIYGSRIPTTGTNTFGIQVTSASNAVYNVMSTNWVATIYNQ